MSGYYYNRDDEPDDDQNFQGPFQGRFPAQSHPQYIPQYMTAPQNPYPVFSGPGSNIISPQQPLQQVSQPFLPSQHHVQPYPATFPPLLARQPWPAQQIPTSYQFPQYQPPANPFFPAYSEAPPGLYNQPIAGPSTNYLSPPRDQVRPRPTRAASVASLASSSMSHVSDNSRSTSPSAVEMAKWGRRNGNGTWSCAYTGCTSRSTFKRGCDLRKHYKRHTKSLFCRYDGCPQATSGGFSSKKDRARHEAKHNPNVLCEWEGCERLFSRVDNMKDHVRRVHLK